MCSSLDVMWPGGHLGLHQPAPLPQVAAHGQLIIPQIKAARSGRLWQCGCRAGGADPVTEGSPSAVFDTEFSLKFSGELPWLDLGDILEEQGCVPTVILCGVYARLAAQCAPIIVARATSPKQRHYPTQIMERTLTDEEDTVHL